MTRMSSTSSHVQRLALSASHSWCGAADSAQSAADPLTAPGKQLQLHAGTSGIPGVYLCWRRLALPDPDRGWRLGQPLDHRAQKRSPLLSCWRGQLLNSTCRGEREGSGVQTEAQQAMLPLTKPPRGACSQLAPAECRHAGSAGSIYLL